MSAGAGVLFVCTGNIFRSLTAEYALRRELGERAGWQVGSAGTCSLPHIVKPVVADYLASLGLDVSQHRRRTVTSEMLARADLVIAMNIDHQRVLLEQFGVSAPLFVAACDGVCEPLPDLDDVGLSLERNAEAAIRHVRATIDRIVELTARLACRLRGMHACAV